MNTALIVKLIIPALAYYGRYTYWPTDENASLSDSLSTITRNVADSISSGNLATLVAILILPTLGLSLRSPLILGIVPVVASRFISDNQAYWSLGFHYNATISVTVAFAAMDGYRRLKWLKPRPAWSAVALAGVLGFSVCFAGFNLGLAGNPPVRSFFQEQSRPCYTCGEIKSMLGRIPDGSRVAADDLLAPYLVDRTEVYGLYSGLLDRSDRKIEPDWVVVDLYRASPEKLKWLTEFASSPGVEQMGEASYTQTSDGMPLHVATYRIDRRYHLLESHRMDRPE